MWERFQAVAEGVLVEEKRVRIWIYYLTVLGKAPLGQQKGLVGRKRSESGMIGQRLKVVLMVLRGVSRVD
jgi:hypothetical protein